MSVAEEYSEAKLEGDDLFCPPPSILPPRLLLLLLLGVVMTPWEKVEGEEVELPPSAILLLLLLELLEGTVAMAVASVTFPPLSLSLSSTLLRACLRASGSSNCLSSSLTCPSRYETRERASLKSL